MTLQEIITFLDIPAYFLYADKEMKTIKKYQNWIGWFGAVCTVTAYFLVSFEVVRPKDLSYQLLNLFGALGLGIICYLKRTYQPMTVNIIWAIIAVLAILLILSTRA